MLHLVVRENGKVYIGDDIIVKIIKSSQGVTTVGIEAPRNIVVDRERVRQKREESIKRRMRIHGTNIQNPKID